MARSSMRISAFEIPTSSPETDGTLGWDKTTLVTCELTNGDVTGFGYTYADISTAQFVRAHLASIVNKADPLEVGATFTKMEVAVRNLGREGVAATAISAVDMAAWDAKARILRTSLVDLLGARRRKVDAYFSGGFISYSLRELHDSFAERKREGFPRFKMKIGRESDVLERVRVAREAIGNDAELFVDANGAYDRKRALEVAEAIARFDVRWFEEPVSSDDLEGLAFLRGRAPAKMSIAAGEYGYTARYFERMLASGAVDVLQADATRCGVTGFLRAAALCEARSVPLSAHCGPSIHAHLGCVPPTMIHVEYFYDHQRIEGELFDGVVVAKEGKLEPARNIKGLGLTLRRSAADRYRIYDETVS